MLFDLKPSGILGEMRPLTLRDKGLIDEKLYKRITGDILYNHCFEYLYSYFANVKAAFLVSSNPEEIVIITRKNINVPKYSIHCPICSPERLIDIVQQLSKLSVSPIRIIDLNTDQKDALLKTSSNWKLYKMGDDQIFDLEKCVKLEGRMYKSIRNGIKYFEKTFDFRVELMNTQKAADDACIVIHDWKQTQGKKYFRVTTGRDVEIFKRFWPIVDNVDNYGYVVYDNALNKPIGATMACRSAKDREFGMELTTKVLPEYRGLTDYLSWIEFRDMLKNGIKYSNEAAIYSPGIRFNKEKWGPVKTFPMFDLEWMT